MIALPGAKEPILVVGMPRSGTSMVAGLFAAHGVWTGRYQQGNAMNAKGHFENLAIKRMLIDCTGGRVPVQEGIACEPVPGLREKVLNIIKREGYRGGPWLFKGTSMYWPLWHDFRPRWICVRRMIGSVLSSGQATGAFLPTGPDAVNRHVQALDFLRDERGGVDVETDQLIAGDFRTLEAALAYCGITMDVAKVRNFIDPALWRHGKAVEGS